MRKTNIHFKEPGGRAPGNYRTGISLHSHTLHSKESLKFIASLARYSWVMREVLRWSEARYRAYHGRELDMSRGWWTPPLAPADAVRLESAQLEEMDLVPFVSLTDHDDIEAAMSLRALDPSPSTPVSVEWTVPYQDTFFHLGIHNLPPDRARLLMSRMEAFTAQPCETEFTEILAELHCDPSILIVFNHPLWAESGAPPELHNASAEHLMRTRGEFIHAVEFNGLRPWNENQEVFRFGQQFSKPVISGGDRHVLEPNANVNLTNAATFAEFIDEIREDQRSNILVMPQFRESHSMRIFHNLLDVFRSYPDHGLGWSEWGDRVFYTLENGEVQSLTQIWGNRPPTVVYTFASLIGFAGKQSVRNALRALSAQVSTQTATVFEAL